MHAVLRAPAVDYLDGSIVPLERELHSVNRIARLDLRENTDGKIEVRCGLVEVLVYLREKRDVLCQAVAVVVFSE